MKAINVYKYIVFKGSSLEEKTSRACQVWQLRGCEIRAVSFMN